jgi:radical SAM-linked protein
VHRIRIRYSREDRARFLSARDLTSVWERALRRAELPIAYSEGFHPHAKVSFPDALPVGVASTGEYAELTFAAPIDAGPDLGRLSVQLPQGMDITTYLEVPDGAPKLARMLGATLWELLWDDAPDADARALVEELDRRAEALLAADTLEVVKRRPSGDKTVDVRPSILALRASLQPSPDDGARTPVLRAVLRNAGSTVRPNDLVAAYRSLAPSDPPVELPDPRLTRRVAQGDAVDGGLREALTGALEPLVPDVAAEAA